jgi:hypothetical protein
VKVNSLRCSAGTASPRRREYAVIRPGLAKLQRMTVVPASTRLRASSRMRDWKSAPSSPVPYVCAVSEPKRSGFRCPSGGIRVLNAGNGQSMNTMSCRFASAVVCRKSRQSSESSIPEHAPRTASRVLRSRARITPVHLPIFGFRVPRTPPAAVSFVPRVQRLTSQMYLWSVRVVRCCLAVVAVGIGGGGAGCSAWCRR